MPKVPYSNNVTPLRPGVAPPSPTMLAMAAAVMHQQGRLFKPKPSAKEVDDNRNQ